jgi:hypothetical protein
VRAVRAKLFFVCISVVLAGMFVAAASAYRAPTKVERRQIVTAIDRFQQRQDCGATHTCHPTISKIRVSLANTAYATANVYVRSVGGALVLLHKLYGTWRVTDIGTEFVGCGKAPKAVRVDLELTCPGGK